MPLSLSNISPTELRVRQARRRLINQSMIDNIGLAWGLSLVASVLCLLALPFVYAQAPENFKWYLVGTTTLIGTVLAIVWTLRNAPKEIDAAVALDKRCDLKERTLTYYSLDAQQRQTPIGKALSEDADDAVKGTSVKDKFPVGMGRRALFLPVLVGAIVAIVLFYQPYIATTLANAKNEEEIVDPKVQASNIQKKQAPPKPLVLKPPVERSTKSDTLKRLEGELELERKYQEAQQSKTMGMDSGGTEREKIEALTKAEDKLKKYEQDLATKFKQLEEQVAKYNALEQGESRNDGPAKEFEDAFSKGDLNKAKEELDTLKKKAKENKLTEDDQKKLEKQVEQMQEKLDKLNREQKKEEQKLKDAIEEAKKEGRDAESLEKELKDQQKKMENTKELDKMADTLKKSKKSLENKDQQELAENLDKLQSEIGGLESELQDLQDAQDHLDNLDKMKRDLTRQSQNNDLQREKNASKDKGEKGMGMGGNDPGGADELNRNGKGMGMGDGMGMGGMGQGMGMGMGMGDGNGNGMGGMGMGMGDGSGGAGVASGRRPESKDGKDNAGNEERIRGNFDPKGRKAYAGATNGPAFKKRTTTELGEEIRQAAQDAPDAIEVQRLPKGAREMVKEYFEKLGGQAPPK